MGCFQSTSATKADSPGDQSRDQPFAFTYKLLLDANDKLGEGQFAVVRKAQHKQSGKIYAVKCIKKAQLNEEDLQALIVEVQVMKKLHHPNLVGFVEFYTDVDYYFLVMELMTGGELFQRIVEKERYSEREARDLVKTLTQAIAYCHEAGVVHRDLKPENILLADPSETALVKIADFGFAKMIQSTEDRTLETACGTPGYVAPEILRNERYGKEVDIWSLGVIFYILLCGYPPFHDSNQKRLFEKIKRAEYEFDSPDWDGISDHAKDLITKILVPDPRRRLTAAQILSHPWVRGSVDVADRDLSETRAQLRKFNARRKLRAGMKTVLTTVRIQRLTQSIKMQMAAEAGAGSGGGHGGVGTEDVTLEEQ
jgi:calcium/calmodulin-dependent protein kinase I